MPNLVDTHCHLNFERFDEDREQVIERALKAGVKRIVVPAIDLESSEQVLRLAEEYNSVYAAVGIHPNTDIAVGEDEIQHLRDLAANPRVVAIGEIGLDYYRQNTAHERQHANMMAQLQLASEVNLPVIVHNREANDDMLYILSQWRANANDDLEERAGVLHSFSAGWPEAQATFTAGFFIGFTGPLTYKKAELLRAIASNAPADRILVETDAPFLTPHPLRGKRNEPAYVRHVAETLAEVRDLSIEEVARLTTANAARLFGWDANL